MADGTDEDDGANDVVGEIVGGEDEGAKDVVGASVGASVASAANVSSTPSGPA